ncbi:DUF885 family protein [Floccifex sp.]|uniref:DUF885 family protein n=1 Tax=Floccifex sp. TaxID=2815810 RepID=UPI003EFDCB22
MKKIIPFILSLCLLCSCASKPSKKENEEFSSYLNDLFIQQMEQDYTTMHQFLENPEDFGVNPDCVEVSLGPIFDSQDYSILLKELHAFDYESLNETQQIIYNQLNLDFNLNLQLNDEKFEYYPILFGSMDGIQEILVTYFSEFVLRNEQDIQDLMTLLQDVPRFTNDALEYTKQQASLNLCRMNYQEVINSIQLTLNHQEDSSIYRELEKEINQLDISNKEEVLQQIQEALQTYFYPSYQLMLNTLQSIKDQILPVSGYYTLEYGKEYYELLVQQATGTTKNIQTIQKELSQALDDTLNEYLSLSNSKENTTTSFTSVEEIMMFLEQNYKKDFPEVADMNYEINALDDDQSTMGIVAYFVTPSLDVSTPFQIRYNKRDYGKDVNDLSLYTTLAHEGIPGHMYNAKYKLENLEYPIQFLFQNNGLSEGYATYVQLYALSYLDFDTDAYRLMEILNFYTVALLDLSIQYDGMTLDELNQVYGSDMSAAYNQLCDAPATFLSYYYGYLEVVQLKEKLKYPDKVFHEHLLEYGDIYFDLLN